MIDVSQAWKDIQSRFLLPESYIEIDCAITNEDAQESATVSGVDEAIFSNTESIMGESNVVSYATNELNLWALDGTRNILPSSEQPQNAGYVGNNTEQYGEIELSFPLIRTSAISGITITWSRLYDEYPVRFTVAGKRGTEVINSIPVDDNKSTTSVVSLELENYDGIVITVHEWSLPHHRVRIEKVVIGHVLTLTKTDLLNYKHEQRGNLLSGELPKYSIEFTLDNSDGRWDPNNPTGMEKYLSERQRLTVRYGLDVNGTVEWIKAGTFYLSEWNTPTNGLEARFVARDVFEFLNTDTNKLPNMSSTQYGNLRDIIEWATRSTLSPSTEVIVDASLDDTPGREFGADGTYAEMVQKSANAGQAIIRYDRDGVLYIEPLDKTPTDYAITQELSYSHPEITLSKPLSQVIVDYGEENNPYSLDVETVGEKQTVGNNYIYTETEAKSVAEWVRSILKSRRSVSGEFRADPRLDIYDIVSVGSKYGVLYPVVITSITYTFNGSFRGSFTGRVLEES